MALRTVSPGDAAHGLFSKLRAIRRLLLRYPFLPARSDWLAAHMIHNLRPDDPYGVGRFHFLKRLGQGGFGTVFVAHDHARPADLVAVKVLSAHWSEEAMVAFKARFVKEVAAIKKLQSRFVPKFIDAGPSDNPPWLATELIHGLSLRELVLPGEGLPEPFLWLIGTDIVSALKAIWASDMVHRDITPLNVVLDAKGPWVVDFGLVRHVLLPRLTSSRQMPGVANPEYAPPEQVYFPLASVPNPAAAEIYMLGGTMLFAATGHPPHAVRKDKREETVNLDGLRGPLFDVIRPCLYASPDARPALSELAHAFAARDPLQAFDALIPGPIAARLAGFERELAELARTCEEIRAGGGRPRIGAPSRRAQRLRSAEAAEAAEVTEPETAPEGMLAGAGAAGPGLPAPGGRTLRMTGSAWAEPAERRVPVPRIGGDVHFQQKSLRRRGSSGNIRWMRQFGAWVSSSVTLMPDCVIAADIDGTIACLDLQDGEVLWWKKIGPVRSSAVPLPSGLHSNARQVCVGDDDGRVYAIDVETGSQKLLIQADGAIQGSPVVRAERVYAVSDDGVLHVCYLETMKPEVLYRANRVGLGPPIAFRDLIVMGDTAGQLLAVSAATGQLEWTVPTAGRVVGLPLPLERTIYASGTDGILRSVTEEGHEQGTAKLTAAVHVAPAHDNGVLYVGSCDGFVQSFTVTQHGPAPFTAGQRYQVGDEIRGLTVVGGRVYVAAGDTVRFLSASGPSAPIFQMECVIAAAPSVSADGLLYLAGLGGRICCASMS